MDGEERLRIKREPPEDSWATPSQSTDVSTVMSSSSSESLTSSGAETMTASSCETILPSSSGENVSPAIDLLSVSRRLLGSGASVGTPGVALAPNTMTSLGPQTSVMSAATSSANLQTPDKPFNFKLQITQEGVLRLAPGSTAPTPVVRSGKGEASSSPMFFVDRSGPGQPRLLMGFANQPNKLYMLQALAGQQLNLKVNSPQRQQPATKVSSSLSSLNMAQSERMYISGASSSTGSSKILQAGKQQPRMMLVPNKPVSLLKGGGFRSLLSPQITTERGSLVKAVSSPEPDPKPESKAHTDPCILGRKRKRTARKSCPPNKKLKTSLLRSAFLEDSPHDISEALPSTSFQEAGFEDGHNFPFKIDSVFSLASCEEQPSDLTWEDVEPETKPEKSIKAEDLCQTLNLREVTPEELMDMCGASFVVLERLDMTSIEKKGFDKIMSKCSSHCRNRTLNYLCMLGLIRCHEKRKRKLDVEDDAETDRMTKIPKAEPQSDSVSEGELKLEVKEDAETDGMTVIPQKEPLPGIGHTSQDAVMDMVPETPQTEPLPDSEDSEQDITSKIHKHYTEEDAVTDKMIETPQTDPMPDSEYSEQDIASRKHKLDIEEDAETDKMIETPQTEPHPDLEYSDQDIASGKCKRGLEEDADTDKMIEIPQTDPMPDSACTEQDIASRKHKLDTEEVLEADKMTETPQTDPTADSVAEQMADRTDVNAAAPDVEGETQTDSREGPSSICEDSVCTKVIPDTVPSPQTHETVTDPEAVPSLQTHETVTDPEAVPSLQTHETVTDPEAVPSLQTHETVTDPEAVPSLQTHETVTVPEAVPSLQTHETVTDPEAVPSPQTRETVTDPEAEHSTKRPAAPVMAPTVCDNAGGILAMETSCDSTDGSPYPGTLGEPSLSTPLPPVCSKAASDNDGSSEISVSVSVASLSSLPCLNTSTDLNETHRESDLERERPNTTEEIAVSEQAIPSSEKESLSGNEETDEDRTEAQAGTEKASAEKTSALMEVSQEYCSGALPSSVDSAVDSVTSASLPALGQAQPHQESTLSQSSTPASTGMPSLLSSPDQIVPQTTSITNTSTSVSRQVISQAMPYFVKFVTSANRTSSVPSVYSTAKTETGPLLSASGGKVSGSFSTEGVPSAAPRVLKIVPAAPKSLSTNASAGAVTLPRMAGVGKALEAGKGPPALPFVNVQNSGGRILRASPGSSGISLLANWPGNQTLQLQGAGCVQLVETLPGAARKNPAALVVSSAGPVLSSAQSPVLTSAPSPVLSSAQSPVLSSAPSTFMSCGRQVRKRVVVRPTAPLSGPAVMLPSKTLPATSGKLVLSARGQGSLTVPEKRNLAPRPAQTLVANVVGPKGPSRPDYAQSLLQQKFIIKVTGGSQTPDTKQASTLLKPGSPGSQRPGSSVKVIKVPNPPNFKPVQIAPAAPKTPPAVPQTPSPSAISLRPKVLPGLPQVSHTSPSLQQSQGTGPRYVRVLPALTPPQTLSALPSKVISNPPTNLMTLRRTAKPSVQPTSPSGTILVRRPIISPNQSGLQKVRTPVPVVFSVPSASGAVSLLGSPHSSVSSALRTAGPTAAVAAHALTSVHSPSTASPSVTVVKSAHGNPTSLHSPSTASPSVTVVKSAHGNLTSMHSASAASPSVTVVKSAHGNPTSLHSPSAASPSVTVVKSAHGNPTSLHSPSTASPSVTVVKSAHGNLTSMHSASAASPSVTVVKSAHGNPTSLHSPSAASPSVTVVKSAHGNLTSMHSASAASPSVTVVKSAHGSESASGQDIVTLEGKQLKVILSGPSTSTTPSDVSVPARTSYNTVSNISPLRSEDSSKGRSDIQTSTDSVVSSVPSSLTMPSDVSVVASSTSSTVVPVTESGSNLASVVKKIGPKSKQSSLERKYLLPPGVVIKTEPWTFGCPTEMEPASDSGYSPEFSPVSSLSCDIPPAPVLDSFSAADVSLSKGPGLEPAADPLQMVQLPFDYESADPPVSFQLIDPDFDSDSADPPTDLDCPDLEPLEGESSTPVYDEPPVLTPVLPLPSLADTADCSVSCKKNTSTSSSAKSKTKSSKSKKHRKDKSQCANKTTRVSLPGGSKNDSPSLEEECRNTSPREFLKDSELMPEPGGSQDDAGPSSLVSPLVALYSTRTRSVSPCWEGSSISSSDRIRHLKEMLKEQNERLEQIRQNRAVQGPLVITDD